MSEANPQPLKLDDALYWRLRYEARSLQLAEAQLDAARLRYVNLCQRAGLNKDVSYSFDDEKKTLTEL